MQVHVFHRLVPAPDMLSSKTPRTQCTIARQPLFAEDNRLAAFKGSAPSSRMIAIACSSAPFACLCCMAICAQDRASPAFGDGVGFELVAPQSVRKWLESKSKSTSKSNKNKTTAMSFHLNRLSHTKTRQQQCRFI